ncbi:hypothetical protein L7F22_042705 [Adiantum nelumboides]|nr:hypothetical protein [Adiantum nelumboides]
MSGLWRRCKNRLHIEEWKYVSIKPLPEFVNTRRYNEEDDEEDDRYLDFVLMSQVSNLSLYEGSPEMLCEMMSIGDNFAVKATETKEDFYLIKCTKELYQMVRSQKDMWHNKIARGRKVVEGFYVGQVKGKVDTYSLLDQTPVVMIYSHPDLKLFRFLISFCRDSSSDLDLKLFRFLVSFCIDSSSDLVSNCNWTEKLVRDNSSGSISDLWLVLDCDWLAVQVAVSGIVWFWFCLVTGLVQQSLAVQTVTGVWFTVTVSGSGLVSWTVIGLWFTVTDCIGSAFNAKGRMQCPNCRQVEPGQWLYASGCFLHEEFVDDLAFEEEVEAYGGAANLHFSPAHWCPHQGSFAQFSLTFEELDNFNSGYVDLRQGSRVSASVGQICPYLAAQGLSLGGPSPLAEDFLGLHGNRSGRSMRRAASFHSSQRNYGQQQASATSSSMPTSYEGSSQNYTPVGGFLQPTGTRQHTLGFLVGSPQSIHTGVNQGTMSPGQIFGQLPLIRSTQGVSGNAHSHSHAANSSRNGFVGNRRTRQTEIPSTPQRASSSEVTWTASEPVHEYNPLIASRQTSSPLAGGDALAWTPAAESQVDPWGSGLYVPQPSIGGSSQWWAWVPPGLFPRPRATPVAAGFSDQRAEGSYAWGYSGFL